MRWALVILTIMSCITLTANEFSSKRETVFEFAVDPTFEKKETGVQILFETKSMCDVTIAIIGQNEEIIRHLASGVLGDNAPEPFQKNSKKQSIYWDGKKNNGEYPQEGEAKYIKVSLGLKVQFEKSLLWSADKRISQRKTLQLYSCDEGVLMADGEGVDQIKLFSHDGEYLRTVFPFRHDEYKQISDLKFEVFPQDNEKLPFKVGRKHFSALLRNGTNVNMDVAKYGNASNSVVIHQDKIGLISEKLAILSLSKNGEKTVVEGPNLCVDGKKKTGGKWKDYPLMPEYSAVSPDGKTIYLSGYLQKNLVNRIEFSKDGVLTHFLGDAEGKGSNKDHEFNGNLGIDCDAKGNLYICDYENDAVKIFSAEGKFLKKIAVKCPILVQVNPKTGDIYVSAWQAAYHQNIKPNQMKKPILWHLGPMDAPKVKGEYELPFSNYKDSVFMNEGSWQVHHVYIDFKTKNPRLWVLPGKIGENSMKWLRRGETGDGSLSSYLKIFEFDGAKELKLIKDFGETVKEDVLRLKPAILHRQRLFVNPANQKLYVAEGDSGVMKSFHKLLEVDPETGGVKEISLPFTAEDMAFDHMGIVYLRTDTMVARYDFNTWREIPYDYGKEVDKVGFDLSVKGREVMSGIELPTTGKPGQFHLGGMSVNLKQDIVISCNNRLFKHHAEAKSSISYGGRKYIAENYPGRLKMAEIHIWDKHGKLIKEDALPGLGLTDGLALDNEYNIFVLMDGVKVVAGSPYFDIYSGTLIKAKANQTKVLSTDKGVEIPLPKEAKPDRPFDVVKSSSIGSAWVEGAEWLYGGVGFSGFNGPAPSCACWNARFALDYYQRSFVPEVARYSVAILDSNGNVILRLGRYGNVDDGKPLVAAGGPPKTNSIGGDEVALFHAAYPAVHTDKRLFISDAGQSRVLSIQLSYHQEKRVELGK